MGGKGGWWKQGERGGWGRKQVRGGTGWEQGMGRKHLSDRSDYRSFYSAGDLLF